MGRADGQRTRQGGGARRGERSGGGIRRVFSLKRILGTLFGLGLIAMAGFVGLYLYVDVPAAAEDAKKQSNVYKYSDGSVLARTGDVNREIVGLDRIPKDVQKTFVAAENKSFYKDAGVDFKGTARGLINTVSGKGKQGGSTITQQYVKNYYLNQDRTVSRKLKELVISLKVDRKKSKDDILAGYINTSYYGRGAYGIQAAAQAYYGKDSDDLTVGEGAYLAALLQAPSQYDWASATESGKERAEARWNYVLDNMVEENWLDASEREGLKFPYPDKPKAAKGLKGQTGYLVEAANRQLKAEGVTEAEIEAGGWTVTLNVDRKKQKSLEKSVKKTLTDKLDKDKRKVDAAVQAGAVSVDPETGKVVALYGGKDYAQHYTSNATRADFQPGSTFKPVILASALDNDAKTQDGETIRANTVYDGTSGRPVKGGESGYAPPNEGKKDYGSISVQRAMDQSVNSVYAQMGADVGMDRVQRTATDLGMKEVGRDPAMTLGSMGASPMDMAGVYATLDNHGKKVTPSIVKQASHKDRPDDVKPDPVGDQVLKRQTADSVTSVMQGVVSDGTGAAVSSGKYQAAGKTGTSDSNVSAWFAGYTPELVTVVGMFGEAPDPKVAELNNPEGTPAKEFDHVSLAGAGGEGKIHGSGFPSRIWAAYTLGALEGGSDARFDLDTDMGMGVAPPPEPTRSEEEDEPEKPDEPAETPDAPEPPDDEPDQPEEPPAETPDPPVTDAPTFSPPTQEPDPSQPTIGIPDQPDRRER
ncbi:Penicillin-binding protein 1A [Streptomyces sp. YIM 130001]|uniref:transglycosylase domain-containing protein n=1 Tax=Streptomyces sp. YIM 130001 TaxID=2259644 RepID=UPI000E648281|nr:transglycosylase domain-containing protein [Streptomyces sp. YIM 130001]RII20797.1 Penicillin-binding protein 1A [Streptomyces sp. YIM 130001]